MAGDLGTVDKPAATHGVDERSAFAVPRDGDTLHALLAPPAAQPTEVEAPSTAIRSPVRGRSLRVAVTAAVREAADTELAYGTLFLMVPLCFLVGIATYFALPTEPAAHNVPVALLALTILRILVRRRARAAWGVNAALIAVLGVGAAQTHTGLRSTPMLGSEVATRLTARVVDIEVRPGGSARYTLDVIKTERPHLRYAPDRVRVTSRKANPEIGVGDGFHSVVQLRPPSGPMLPGGYDFAFYAFFAGYGANGFSYGMPEQVDLVDADGASLAGLSRAMADWRVQLANHIMAIHPDRPATAIAAALVTGKKSAIPEDINEQLRASGLAHILSISGLHMALVAGTIMFALRAGLSLDPVLSSRWPVKKLAAGVALLAAAFYLFLAGASVATQRSFIMLAIMLAALCLDRAALTKRNLALAAMAVMILSPDSVLGPGFQMSFAATLALIGGYDVLNRARFALDGSGPGSGVPEVRPLPVRMLRALGALIAAMAF
ncbi:MAG: ComEC/Rec2 family competence protein, partial [Pseudomonadota bacterium]